jgi:ABC-type bacteriocin/lantibiotic exporter with double-glycine peptidase domain
MKYPIVLQHSEEDCGAACIATIAKFYGRTLGIGRIRSAVGTGMRGTTLLGLRRGSEALGFNARPVKATSELIDKIEMAPLPAIVHWSGNHWVVLYGRRGRKFIIGDPAVGIRYLSRQELMEDWEDGVLLMLQPDELRFRQQPEDKTTGFGKFLRRVLPYTPILLQAVAINIVIGLLSLAAPLMMQVLTDDVLVRGDRQLLITVGIGVICLDLFKAAIGIVQSLLIGHFGQRLQLGLYLDYGFKLLRLPMSYFDSHRSGEVVSRLGDADRINDLISQVVLGLPSQFFVALVSLGFMLFYSPQLTMVSLIAFVVLIAIDFAFYPALQKRMSQLTIESAENQGFLVETFRGAMILKTTQATPQAWAEYQRNFGRLANLEWKTMTLGITTGTITQVVGSVTTIGLLWWGSYLVIDKTLSIGQLIAFASMSGNLFAFLGALVEILDEFASAKVAVQRLDEVMEMEPEEDYTKPKQWVTIAPPSHITCDDLNFHHAGRVKLLNDFNLTIPGGCVTALIGQSGCGKSTLTKLITGLYPLQSGNIRYGSFNQQDIALDCLRQQAVLVPQSPHFWSRSIIENFQFTNPDISFEQIVRACEMACIDGFISTLPEKYNTVLGEFGANISGGQQQRLAIARAIINDPPILILDESTAALDPLLESEVLDRILSHRVGKTTIVISHRPRVILRADFVVYIDRGEVKLTATPEELAQIPGDHLHFLHP